MPPGLKNMLTAVCSFHLSPKPCQFQPLLASMQSLGKISHPLVFAATPTCSTHVSALPLVLCGQAIGMWLAISIYGVGFYSFMSLIYFILQSTPSLPPAKNQTALLNSFHTPPSGRLMIWCCLFLDRRVQVLQHSNHLIIFSSAFQIPNLSEHFLQLPVNCSSSLVNKSVNVKAEKNPKVFIFSVPVCVRSFLMRRVF